MGDDKIYPISLDGKGMNDLSGQYLGRYRLTERLGEGGMAVVYKGYDTRLERDVAVKIIRSGAFPTDTLGEILKRFEREAKSLAKLSHPNIVKVYDYGEHEGEPYLVMEYLPGGTLKKLLGKSQPWQDALRLILPVARGVSYAHQRGVLHRDIKPANVLMTDGGEPMLSDFGIAKLFGGDQTTTLTGSGMAIGTPDYMAPEQWTGVTSPQSDLYSLAIVLYEMVTGRKPYEADTPAELLIKQATQPLPSPREFAVDLPEAVEQVLLTSLAREPKDRFENIAAFIKALEYLDVTASIALSHAPKKPIEKTVELHPPKPVAHIPTKTFPQIGGDTINAQGLVAPEERSIPSKPVAANRPSRRWVGFLIGGVVIAVGLWLASPTIGRWFEPLQDSTKVSPSTTQQVIETQTLKESQAVILPSTTSTPSTSATATATPVPDIGSTLIRENDSMEMVFVSAGEFYMGSSCHEPGCVYKQGGRIESTDAFWIDKTEVSVGMYATCVLSGVCTSLGDLSLASIKNYYANLDYVNYPVVNVSFQQAETYCNWSGGRLPNNKEWEKAARGTDGRGFPWGDEYKGHEANSCDIKCNDPNSRNPDLNDGYTFTAPVGSFPDYPSPYGTLNMAGNVREMVEEGVFRGGAWDTPGRHLWTFSLISDDSAPSDAIGFRCVIDVNP